MGVIHQPLNVNEGIKCMNNLIRGTDHAEALAEFQRARKLGSKDFEHGTVTQGWRYGFLQRHKDKIVTKQVRGLLAIVISGLVMLT